MMNFDLFKFSLLVQLKEFRKASEEARFEPKNFDEWLEEFMRFSGYTVTDDIDEKEKQ